MKRIGILCGSESALPTAFVDRINGKAVGEVHAEAVRIGGLRLRQPGGHAVLLDRVSVAYPFYRSYLKTAVLDGTIVINNPFWCSADDPLFALSLAARLGLSVPRTVLLPPKELPPGLGTESLRNLRYPLDWEEICEEVGFPAILRLPGFSGLPPIGSLDELFRQYDTVGSQPVLLQQSIEYEHYVRCFCLGKANVIPVKYDPPTDRYHVDHEHLTADLGARVVRDAQMLSAALGYDVSTVDFAISKGAPILAGVPDPYPRLDPDVITPFYFEQIVELTADMAIDYALHGKPSSRELRWDRFLAGETTRD